MIHIWKKLFRNRSIQPVTTVNRLPGQQNNNTCSIRISAAAAAAPKLLIFIRAYCTGLKSEALTVVKVPCWKKQAGRCSVSLLAASCDRASPLLHASVGARYILQSASSTPSKRMTHVYKVAPQKVNQIIERKKSYQIVLQSANEIRFRDSFD